MILKENMLNSTSLCMIGGFKSSMQNTSLQKKNVNGIQRMRSSAVMRRCRITPLVKCLP
uniref:Alternative protein NAP1L3 n=1 Tax=Homo sapiens TaxID=9606 RepID=L0R6L2_HUMAN|nr:alternative protein NAP1L3 [Homo sapiens]